MNYNDITCKGDIKEYLKHLNKKCILIYSKTSIQKNNININNKMINAFSTEELTIEKNNIDKIISNIDEFEKIICIGGGTAIDIGKYLSNKHNKPLVCVPTMLSTNAYSTSKVAIVVNGKKETLYAVLPGKIILDEKILSISMDNNLYGIADIFSIYTALNDWKLAEKYNNELITSEFSMAEDLLNETIEYILNNDLTSIESNLFYIYKLVGESGEITNRYGSGKPESGSEHIFAKALEKEIKIPHAIAVANGILLMSLAQSMYLHKKVNLKPYFTLKKIGIYELNNKYNIGFELICNVFMNLTPREDRYSVVNLIYKDEEKKKKVLEQYREIINNK